MATQKTLRRIRIRRGIRNKISGSDERPRLSVYKSNRGLFVQVIDDIKGHTLVSVSSNEFSNKKSINIETAKSVGKRVAEKALENGIKTIIFDRNGYLYHGKIKALAEGAREGGLKF
ncbi:MAG: 50S ribosomal protein L18 [Candidatus Cyclobacteriaceae bacterium M3_2C_046]